MKVAKLIVLGWFFLTFWNGRVTKVDLKGQDACQFSRGAAVRVMGENLVSACWEDK
jgi:hypothetical protein